MVTMHRGPNWKVSVYGREHGLGPFHIEGPGFRASVGIVSLTVVVGRVPASVLDEAVGGARLHQAELLAKWQELNP